MTNLIVALQITAVGMSLVFGAVLLLWLVMSLLVRLTAGRQAAPTLTATADGLTEMEIRQRAAAAAVAVALAGHAEPRGAPAWPSFTAPLQARVSIWQTVMRGRGFKQQGPRR